MRTLNILVLILIFGCSGKPESQKIEGLPSESEPNEPEVTDTRDCVFNNDYHGLASDWMSELGIENFGWDELNSRTFIVEGTDTIYFTKGGCSHFEISVEQVITGDKTTLSDSGYWVNKSRILAERFGYDFYSRSIKEHNVLFIQHDPTEGEIWFDFNDDDTEDNLIYNGINVIEEENKKTIWISIYYN